ncbi:murein DD-endopeptidase MepM/ murein hydrolase activator NlpD [Rhodoligotrophos appendicifer]|uniref:peptidoglycan DD-metalloendopeptidase family protein n=1 Tax=Rhodoligotrophos appendicifer TaxID=987056 RepID=UPI0011860F4E|nr:peptidoglycan DD-metalloendopeptidase family protein [Rhodoligotrophos appendicifer]
MRCSTISPLRARRVARLAGAVALAGLSAACSADMSRFGPATTGSTGGYATSAAPVSSAPTDAVQTSQVPPAGGGAYSTGAYQGGGAYQPPSGYASAPASAPVPTNTYAATSGGGNQITVRSGQTLYAVARENGVSVNQIVAANGLTPPYEVRAGQILRLPGGASAAAGGNGSVSGVRNASASAPLSAGGSHTAKSGETLYSLGRAYNVSPMAIADLNGYTTSYQLRVGETVKIPNGASAMTENGRSQSTAAGTKVASLGPTSMAAAPGPSTLGTLKTDGSGAVSGNALPQQVPSASPAQSASLPAPETRSAASFRWPVKGRIISKYGDKPNGSRNDGINIAVPEGTSVRASENGVVAYSGSELKGFGNLVLIRHEGGWVTAYAHNKELLVKRGEQVKRGDIIAKAGATGSVTSPQVHFEIRKGAQAVDPMGHLGSTYLASD